MDWEVIANLILCFSFVEPIPVSPEPEGYERLYQGTPSGVPLQVRYDGGFSRGLEVRTAIKGMQPKKQRRRRIGGASPTLQVG